MNRILILIWLLCISLCLITTGCQDSNNLDKAVEVVIEGDGQFPQFLVGKWKADKGGWEINFDPDGKISSAVVSMGRIRVKPGEITQVPMKMDGKSIFEPGQWLVHYNSDSRELTVTIVIKHFYMELGDSTLDGDITDVITGTVDENGNFWRATDTTYSNITGHIPNQDNFDFSSDPTYGFTTELVFKKITE